MRKLVYLWFLIGAMAQGQSLMDMQVLAHAQANAESDIVLATQPGNLLGYGRENTILAGDLTEGNDVTPEWTDLSGNGNHATSQTAKPTYQLDGTVGQVRWNNVNSSGLTIQANGGSMDLDFGAGADGTFMFQAGEILGADTGCIICKSEGTAANRQYQIAFVNATSIQIYIAGEIISTETVAANSLVFIVIDSGSVDVWVDGALVENDNTFTGTGTTSSDVYLGQRSGGGYNPTADIRKWAIWNVALTGVEIGLINDDHNVN